MSFVEAFVRLRICSFRLRVLQAKPVIFSAVLTLLLLNSSFPLGLSESQGMFNLGQIFRSKNLKGSLL